MDKIVPSLLFNMQKIEDVDRYFYSWSLVCFLSNLLVFIMLIFFLLEEITTEVY